MYSHAHAIWMHMHGKHGNFSPGALAFKECVRGEGKLKAAKEERDSGNCTSVSSISWRWPQTPGHT